MREREQKASGRPASEAEELEMSADTGILGETTTSSSDPVSGPKSGRSRFSFSRAKLKGTEHLEEAARKSAESARVNNNHSQSRYIILPSNKSSHNNQQNSQHHHHHSHHHQQHHLNQQQQGRRSSPTSNSSSPLIDFLTSDEPSSDFSEETHVLIPSPLFPVLTSTSTSNVPSPRTSTATCCYPSSPSPSSLKLRASASPPPRPTTRHPGCSGSNGSSDSGLIKGSLDDTTTTTTTVTGSVGNNRGTSNNSNSNTSNSNSGLGGGGGGGGSGLAQRGSGSGLVNKPPKGWLHPEQLITSIGVTYSVKYIGCLQINTSMRSLDFETRSNIAKECISRVCKASGLPVQEPNRKSDHRILKMLADHPDLDFTGCQVNLSITSASLNLTVIETGEVIAKHEMPNISFASNGDIELMDFVSYVAKDSKHGRACFVLHCVGGTAQDVINTIGQAFELRFKEFLKRAPRPDTKTDLASVEVERDYYNDLPGKVPPDMGSAPSSARMSCNLIPSICSNSSSNNPASASDSRSSSRLPQAAPRNAAVKKAEDRDPSSDQLTNLIDLGCEPPATTATTCTSSTILATREYVNYHSSTSSSPNCTSPSQTCAAVTLTTATATTETASPTKSPTPASPACGALSEDEQAKDPFDMKPFNCTLQELSRRRLLGSESESLNTHTWFHGTISRKESELLVEKDGDFLVRESIGSPGQFVLTGKQGGLCQHLLLVDPSGIVRTKDLSFESVLHLIRHHRENNLPIVSAESVLHLRNPVSMKGPTV